MGFHGCDDEWTVRADVTLNSLGRGLWPVLYTTLPLRYGTYDFSPASMCLGWGLFLFLKQRLRLPHTCPKSILKFEESAAQVRPEQTACTLRDLAGQCSSDVRRLQEVRRVTQRITSVHLATRISAMEGGLPAHLVCRNAPCQQTRNEANQRWHSEPGKASRAGIVYGVQQEKQRSFCSLPSHRENKPDIVSAL